MTTQELEKPPLSTVRRQIQINELRGDRLSYDGYAWFDYGKNIVSYEKSFAGVLSNNSVKDLLKGKENLVVIDLMAPSGTIASLFTQFPDRKKFGLAVSLEDLRSKEEKERDIKLNITQISGDIMKSSTWSKIEEQLQGRKATLVMERATCGFDCIPSIPKLYAVFLSKVWGFLSKDGGITMAELPTDFVDQTRIMLNGFRENSKIEASMGKGPYPFGYSMKLVRNPNSPEKLPFPKMR
jgi:hypothetical protein